MPMSTQSSVFHETQLREIERVMRENGSIFVDPVSGEFNSPASGVNVDLTFEDGLMVGASWADNGFNNSNQSIDARGFLGLALARSGAPLRKLWNGGVSGQNTEQMLARIDGLLNLYKPAFVCVDPSQFNSLAAGFTAARTVAALQALYDRIRLFSSVAKMAVCTMPPTGAFSLGTTTGNGARIWYNTVNTFIRNYARKYSLMLFDAEAFYSNADGSSIRANYYPAAESGATIAHSSYRGSSGFASVIQSQVDSLSATRWQMAVRRANDYRNILGPATIPQGSNTAGTGGVPASSTGVTITSAPNGMFPRTYPGGPGTPTGTLTSITNPYYDGAAARMVCSLNAKGSAIGMGWGHAQSSRNNYTNTTQANNQAYNPGERIQVSPDKVIQVYGNGGTSAADFSSQDYSGLNYGQMVVSGTVTFICTRKPKLGDKYLLEVDCAVTNYGAGTGDIMVLLRFDDPSSNVYDSYINFCLGISPDQSPWDNNTGRRLYRNVIDTGLITNLSDIRTIAVYTFAGGDNGATPTIENYGACLVHLNDL